MEESLNFSKICFDVAKNLYINLTAFLFQFHFRKKIKKYFTKTKKRKRKKKKRMNS